MVFSVYLLVTLRKEKGATKGYKGLHYETVGKGYFWL